MLEQHEGLNKIIAVASRLKRHEEFDTYFSGDWKAALENQYFNRIGKRLQLDPPRTFNEKLQWLKLYWRDSLAGVCANKYSMRQYVQACGYGELLHPLLAVWDDVDRMDFDDLPQSFVIKAAHTSGLNMVVQNKNELDVLAVREAFRTVMGLKYYSLKYEWVYEAGPPCLLCELMFPDVGNRPLDYKYFCFNGVVRTVQALTVTDAAGLTDDTNAYFCDPELHSLRLTYGYNPIFTDPIRPSCYEQMVSAAEALSKPFPFVRVDFCVSQNQPWLGEFTFFPAAGYDPFEPYQFDYKMGGWLNVEKI